MKPPRLMRSATTLAFLFGLAIAAASAGCTSASTSVVAPSATKCQAQVTNSALSFGSSGGSGVVTIATDRDCTWAATSDANWLVLSSAKGQGAARVPYSVRPNAQQRPRSGAIHVGITALAVTQAAAPPLPLTPPQLLPMPSPAPIPAPVPAPAPNPVLPAPAPGGGQSVSFDGTLTGMYGICPIVFFSMNGYSIATTLATSFNDGGCGDLSNGRAVSVQGATNADGLVIAIGIDFKR